MNTKLLKLLLIALIAGSCNVNVHENSYSNQPPKATYKEPKKAKNVILLIGDGMGVTHITSGMYLQDDPYNLERFRVIGLHKNHASDDLITDSAAGATAFSAGVKTYNGAIGVNSDGASVPTILEEAKKNGLATGLVATSEITHATPASFIAHVESRREYEEIALSFLDSDVDFFVGGGKKYFDRRESDSRNLVQELEEKGYMISDYSQNNINDLEPSANQNFGFFTADDKPVPFMMGRDYLTAASMMGIELLNADETGFFMMIEGSQIDWGGHANNIDYVTSEMNEFDALIGKVLDFAEADGQTLVIVTADHECGGLTLVPGSTRQKMEANFSTDKHTLSLIPVFAYGPGATLFGGIYDNTSIYHKMRQAYGW